MKIKVTGYMDTDDMPEEYVDLDNETGLSEAGFDRFAIDGEFAGPYALESPEFKVVKPK